MEVEVDEEGNLIEKPETAPVIPENTSLEKASWQNVVSLLETQNSLLAKKLENLEPSLTAIMEQAATCKGAAEKCSNKVDEMTALKADIPNDVDAGGVEQLPEEIIEDKPIKKKGLFSKR